MASMEETEREELFERMNKYERSRIINLAEKHCAQMMDLIHRYRVQGMVQPTYCTRNRKCLAMAAVQ